MARPILVSTFVLAAFGIGFGARNVIDHRIGAPLAKLPDAASSESLQVLELANRSEPIAPPAPIPPPFQLKSSGPPEPQPAGAEPQPLAPPQLAYAPILPEPPPPLVDLQALPPPPESPASIGPALPSPELAGANPPKLTPFSAADVDAVREVIAQMRKGDVAAADATIKRMSDPAAKIFGEWALVRSGLRNISYARISAFMQRNPDWPTHALLQRRAEEAIVSEQKSPAEVRAYFDDRPPSTVTGRIALARALLADKRRDEAFRLIRTVWREDNFSDETEARLAEEFADGLRREDHRARMERFIFRDETVRAMRSAQRAGADYASLIKARQAVEKKSANAKALIEAVPKTLRADASYAFARAQFFRKADQAVEAVKALEGAPRDPDVLVDGDEWWAERRAIARKLLDAGDAKLAYKAAAEHGAETDAMRVEAEFHAGWIALRFLKDAKLALEHFNKAAEAAKLPMSTSRVAYWQGRAAEAAGDSTAAEQFYKSAADHGGFFYGQLARAKLPSADSGLLDSLATPPDPSAMKDDPALRAIDLLFALNEREMAMSMIVDMAQRSGSQAQLDALGEMLQARRDARTLLVLGKLAMQRGVSLDRHAFPTFAIPTYQPLASLSEPAIVHSIARQESAFNPKAISHAGARGLMQLMPGTARITANRYKTPYDFGKLTEDASYNAQIGAAHLSDLLEEWRGSYILVFAAYNAGSHNVKKWIAAYGDPREPGIDPVDWIERIPFNETRNYVQRIMENLQVYRGLLSPGAPFLMETDMTRGARRSVADIDKAPPAVRPAAVSSR